MVAETFLAGTSDCGCAVGVVLLNVGAFDEVCVASFEGTIVLRLEGMELLA